jgi:hypothetical protein
MTPGCVHSISYIDFQSSEIVPLGVNYYLLTYLWHSILGLIGEVSSLSCDREFTDCRLQTCFVQSPNFPGVYPRNRRCLYHVSTRQPFIKVNHVRLIIYNQHPQKMLTRKVCRCSFSLKTESSTLTAKDATITSCAPSDLLAKKLALTTLSGLIISDRNLSLISNLILFFFCF